MIVAGVHVRRSDKRYDAALAIVNGATLLDHTHVPAPAGASESEQLWDLSVRATEVTRPYKVELVVLWPPDPPPGGRVKLKTTLSTGRAEGAILAAAGALGIPSDYISGGGVRAAGEGATEEAVGQLCAPVNGVPNDDTVRRAVAAARAWVIRNH